MIEAPELITATQRKLHDRWIESHRKFFPSPPVFSKPQAKLVDPPVVAPVIEPETPTPKPIKRSGPPITLDQTNLRLKVIKEVVCAEFNISQQALVSERRNKEIVQPRHMFSYLASRFTKASLPRLGRCLGGQDHTTILTAIRRMKVKIRDNRGLGEQAKRLEAVLRQAFGETDTPRNCIGRYVEREKIAVHEMIGWMWMKDLKGNAALMIWPCACECVEPKE